MEKITLAEHKYVRLISVLALKNLQSELSSPLHSELFSGEDERNALSDIGLLLQHDLEMLDSELTSEERLKINPIIYNNSDHPMSCVFEFIDKVDVTRTNVLLPDSQD